MPPAGVLFPPIAEKEAEHCKVCRGPLFEDFQEQILRHRLSVESFPAECRGPQSSSAKTSHSKL